MKQTTIELPGTGERFLRYRHKSGLQVLFAQKNLHTSYAALSVRFGALHERTGDPSAPILPDGTAHFLEHKLFANEDGEDTFEKFARTGAAANAFTGHESTCYLFSAASAVHESLEILLKSVFSPWFTDENVKSEKPIILEELKMYLDDPADKVQKRLMRMLYSTSRLRCDVGGTGASVKKITKEDLYAAYRRYYHPANLVLSLCGRFDPEKVEKILDDSVPSSASAPPPVRALTDAAPGRCARRRGTIYVNNETPMAVLGIKGDLTPGGSAQLKRFTETGILCHVLFSASCPFTAQARKENLIPYHPNYEWTHSPYASHVTFSAYAYDPEEVFARFFRYARRLRENGVEEADFLRGKKAAYASLLDNFNTAEDCAQFYLADALEDLPTEQTPQILAAVTKNDVDALAALLLQERRLCALKVLPESRKPARKQ